MNRSSFLFFNISLMIVLSSFSFTAHAEESGYTPPPLFGGGNETPIIDVIPAPTLPPVAEGGNAVPIEKLDTRGNITLDESASVAVRVPTPVQDRAPINVDVLLDHPANRVAEGAKPLVSELKDDVPDTQIAPSLKKQSRIPDFASYDSTALVTQKEGDSTSKDLSIPSPQKKKRLPSLSPQVEKILDEKPEVAVYSRDKKTGEFVKVTGKNTTSGKRTLYRARPIATDPDSVSTSVRADSSPPTQPKGGTRDVLDALEHQAVPPIELDDLRSGILDVPDMPAVRALPLADQTMAKTEPLAGGAPENKQTLFPTDAPHVIVPFASGQTDMNNEQKGRIQDNVLGVLQKTPQIRVEIQAYAAPSQQSSDVTRIALGRGLAVRQYLKENGVKPEQITVRALVASETGPEADRVDILFK